MDDELLMARDPDGGMGRCLPLHPGDKALKLDHVAVVVKDVERAARLFAALGYAEEQRFFEQGVLHVVMTKSGVVLACGRTATLVTLLRHRVSF